MYETKKGTVHPVIGTFFDVHAGKLPSERFEVIFVQTSLFALSTPAVS